MKNEIKELISVLFAYVMLMFSINAPTLELERYNLTRQELQHRMSMKMKTDI